MDLQYRDIEKSASAAISLCALDESDDRHADSAPIRRSRWVGVGANGVELPKAAEPGVRAGCDAGQTMDRAGFPKIRAWRKRSVLSCLPMRAACDLTFMPGRPGIAGKPCCPPHWQTLSSQYAVCELGQRRTAVHDLAEAALSGAVHRVPAPVDHKLSEKDLSRRRRIARTQGQVGASLRAPGERPPPTVLSPAVLAGNQPDELVWNDVKNHGVARTLIRAPRDLHRAVSSKGCDCCKKIRAKFARSSRWKRRVMQPLSS